MRGTIGRNSGKLSRFLIISVLMAALSGLGGCLAPASSPLPGPEPVAPSMPAPEPTPAPEAPYVLLHTVEPGDSLWKIARSHGMSVTELAGANGIADAGRIRIGQVIRIPVTP